VTVVAGVADAAPATVLLGGIHSTAAHRYDRLIESAEN
jgi:hypothetical protein